MYYQAGGTHSESTNPVGTSESAMALARLQYDDFAVSGTRAGSWEVAQPDLHHKLYRSTRERTSDGQSEGKCAINAMRAHLVSFFALKFCMRAHFERAAVSASGACLQPGRARPCSHTTACLAHQKARLTCGALAR